MKEKKDDKSSSSLALGMSLGMCFGAAIGSITGNIGFWLPIGLCLGMLFDVLFIYFKDAKRYPSGKDNKTDKKTHTDSNNTEPYYRFSKYDEKTGEFYPVLNGDADTATMLVTLPDGSKGWTDGLGNGYIR